MTRAPLLPTLLLCLALIANSVGAAWATTLAGQAGCRHAAGRAATASADAPAAAPRSHAHHAGGHDAHAAVPDVHGHAMDGHATEGHAAHGHVSHAHATAQEPPGGGDCEDCAMPPQADRSDALADHGGHHDSHAADGACDCASGGCACPALHVAHALLPPTLLLDSAPVHVRLAASGPDARPAPPPAVPTRPPILG